MSRASRPPGASRLAATGRTVGKRSTARRVMRLNLAGGLAADSCSARRSNTLMFVNVRARTTSRRNVDFLWLDSISVRSIAGAQSLMGIPGKPAPEPRSATRMRSSVVGRWSLAESKFFNTGDTEDAPTSKSFNAENAEDAEEGRGNTCCAAKRLSPKWRVTISSSLRMAVRLMRAFQRRSISMYVDI